MDGEQSRLREAQRRTLAPELAQFRQQLEVQFQQQLESLQAQFVSQLEEQRAAMQHAQSETQALRHQLELARQQTDAVNRAEGPAPNPVASVHRVKALQPAPMTYYSGERSRLAVTDWCTAAQDRVFGPAKREWALMGCQWTSDQELEVVSTLTTYLTGDAKGWYQSLSASEKPSSVQAFLKVVSERFLPFETEEQVRAKLLALRQGRGSVQEYEAKFRTLAIRCEDLSEKDRMFYFSSGLQTTIKKDVAKMEPKTYQEMVRWAIKMDEIENDRSPEEQVNIQTWTTAAQQGPLQAFGMPARTDYAPMELGNAAAKHHGKTKEGSGGKRRPKRNDTCNRCGQKGHWVRDCKASPPGTSHAKERQVHSLELCAARKEPEMCPSELIEIEALVDEKPAAAIVDTGATHTFLSSRWCQLAGMPVNKARGKPVGVRLADGSLKNTLGTARVFINVPGTEASEQDVVVYDGRRDLILGMDWLRRNKTALQVGGRVLMNVELDHNVLHCPARHDCDICKFAKIRKKRAPRRAKQGDKDEDDMPPPFNTIVSVDLLDPGQPGGDGTRFLLTHLDHSTKWFQVASMADKSADEALRAFLELQRGKGWPKVLRSDGGSEFKGVFEVQLRNHLVAHEPGVAHRPNTHATHERVHVDLNAGVRALLLQAGLPTDWFPAAARYYALARNLTWKHDGPSGKKTAYEARFGRAWDKSVPPFGSGVIVYNEGHAKFEPTGRAAIVVGLVLTHDHHMNLEVVPIDDLRMDAAKPVLEWKILDHSFPANSLRLRPTYEDQTEHLHFGQFATGDEEISAEIRFCARCSRPEPGVVRCDKCRFGAAARSRHVVGAACKKQQCDCPRNAFGQLAPAREVGRRRAQCAWTEAEDAAIRSGIEHFGPRWQTIVDSHPDVFKLNFRSGKDVRARAVNLKLVKEPREQPQLEISTIELEIDALDENPECLVTEAIPAAAAMKTPDGRAALEKEMKTLSESGTLKLENVIQREDAAALKDARFVKLKPIFGVKNSELPPEHHKTKCRVVAQGCIVTDASKRRVVDSEFSFDKPAGIVAMRMAMSAAILENGREAEGVFFDIDGAYLHAPLKGPPVYGYVRELAGILKGHAAEKCKRMNEPVVKIERALYGLKRSGSDFSHYAREKLISIGWLESSSDRNLYSKKEKGGSVTYLVLYVDDGAIFGRSDAAARAMEEIKGLFEISRTSQLSAASKEQPVLYLGINIYPEGNAAAWVLDMEAYATMVATKAPESRQRSTPLSRRVEAVESLHKQACSEEHRSTIGQLLWLTRTTRPDLAHAVCQIARHVDRWTSDAERALTEVLKYLVKHTSVALRYTIPIKGSDSGIHLEAHCDADFHADGSTSGHVLFFKEPADNTRHLVDWGSRRQRRTAASTAEAEIVAMHDVTQLCVFPAATFISELGEWPAVRILADNETALKAVARGFSDKLLYANKTQRISIKWLHELTADELVGFEYIATRANQADALTKPTSADVFRKTLHSWGLRSPQLSLPVTFSRGPEIFNLDGAGACGQLGATPRGRVDESSGCTPSWSGVQDDTRSLGSEPCTA